MFRKIAFESFCVKSLSELNGLALAAPGALRCDASGAAEGGHSYVELEG
jgi:hypothetical protein